ncbi:MAG TPA: hypothetical protein VLJ42_10465 [Solirubrobacteraceae bacterium]|nr:hypothetical protein [Solirubrobacteraceae bacterium]
MPPEDTRTFTQEEVNTLLAKERRTDRAEIESLRAQLGEHATTAAEAAKRLTEVEGQLRATTAERDAAKAEHEQARTAHAAELNTLQARHTETLKSHRDAAEERALQEALVATGELHAPALGSALREFRRLIVVESDDAGKIGAITFKGARFDKPADAGRAYLKEHPWFAKGAAGGGGHTRPTTGHANGGGGLDLTNANIAALAERGWTAPLPDGASWEPERRGMEPKR